LTDGINNYQVLLDEEHDFPLLKIAAFED